MQAGRTCSVALREYPQKTSELRSKEEQTPGVGERVSDKCEENEHP